MPVGRGSSVAVGLSFEEDTVKYTELKQASGGRYKIGIWGVRRFGAIEESGPDADVRPELELPVEEMLPGGVIVQPWTVGVLNKLKKYPVFTSFADKEVLLKFISLPELSEQEVARMVELRHREYLPMQRAEIVYDFAITRFRSLQTSEEEGGEGEGAATVEIPAESELRVMVTGIERGSYLAYIEAISSGGVILRSIEINQCALTRGCNFFLAPTGSLTYAVLYLNDLYSIINFVVEGGLYYSRLLEPGLQSLTPDEAGGRRIERLLRELYRSVDFFSVESKGIPVETLYVANGGAVPDPAISFRIQNFLAERMAVDVKILHEVAEEHETLALPSGTLAGTLVLPIGLALRSSRGEMGS